jgi:hypothetical protein
MQPISVPIGQWLSAKAKYGTDINSVWQNYISTPAPDVLFLGASWARADIDEGRVAAELSKVAGHPVTVGKMGFAAQGPPFIDAVMYEIMKRSSRPKLVVVTLQAPDLNGGCASCVASVTDGLWQMTDLGDPGWVQLALHNDSEPARLVAGWALPSLAYYPSLQALQCIGVEYGRSAAQTLLGRVPGLLSAPTACERTVPYLWTRQAAMTNAEDQAVVYAYEGFLSQYSVSAQSVSSLEDLVSRARAKGTDVAFLQPPLHSDIRSIGPLANAAFEAEAQQLESRSQVNVIDLSASVPDDPTLWVDPLHLDIGGADYLAPRLAAALGPHLPTS